MEFCDVHLHRSVTSTRDNVLDIFALANRHNLPRTVAKFKQVLSVSVTSFFKTLTDELVSFLILMVLTKYLYLSGLLDCGSNQSALKSTT